MPDIRFARVSIKMMDWVHYLDIKHLFILIFAPFPSSSWTRFLHWQLAVAWTRVGCSDQWWPVSCSVTGLPSSGCVHLPGLDYTAPPPGLVLTARDGLSCSGVGTTQHQVSCNCDLCYFPVLPFTIPRTCYSCPSRDSLHLIDPHITVSHYYCNKNLSNYCLTFVFYVLLVSPIKLRILGRSFK